jgi:hypothetical protein
MRKSRVIFILSFFAAATLAVQTAPAVAQYRHWQHRSPFAFSRHYAQFRQESPWRRWGPARQMSSQPTQRPTHTTGRFHEGAHAPKSIGLYNPGNTSGAQYMNASSSRPNGGYPSMNGGVYRNPGSSSQGIGSSSQGAGSSSQGAGTSSRNTDSSSASGYQSSETRYICVVAGMGYCGFNGRPNISSGSRCHCGEASGLTR